MVTSELSVILILIILLLILLFLSFKQDYQIFKDSTIIDNLIQEVNDLRCENECLRSDKKNLFKIIDNIEFKNKTNIKTSKGKGVNNR